MNVGDELAYGPGGAFGIGAPSSLAKERRERIATAVLAGFASIESDPHGLDAAKNAVLWADSLIAELDR